jgi:hypothetical protein
VFVACNGVFLEKEFLSEGISGSKVQLEEIQETPENVLGRAEPIHDVQDVVQPIVKETLALRWSTRPRRVTEQLKLLTMG